MQFIVIIMTSERSNFRVFKGLIFPEVGAGMNNSVIMIDLQPIQFDDLLI